MDEAYAAGMKPHEFFDLTPGEVTRWLGPAWKGRMETAYHHERMHRVKKLPPKASDLFKPEAKILPPDEFYRHTKNIVAQFNERMKNAPPVSRPKAKRPGLRKP